MKIKTAAIILALSIISATAVSAKQYSPEEVLKEETEIKGTDTAVLTIDETNIIKPVNKEMFGVGLATTTAPSVYESFAVPGTMDLTNEAKELSRSLYKMPIVRLNACGSVENAMLRPNERKGSNFESMYDGKPTTHSYAQQGFGLFEQIKFIYENNPDAKFSIIIDIDDDPQTLADFACFLKDEKTESEWGALRAELGIEKPIDAYFELGNERDESPGWKFNQKQMEYYMERARKIIDAVDAVCPEMKYIACGKTAMWNDPEGTVKWTRGLAEALGKDMDYVSMHPYYSGYELPLVEPYFKMEMDVLDEVLGEGHGIKLYITEHAKWPALSIQEANDLRSLESVLATAAFLNRETASPYIQGAMYHTFLSGGVTNWSIIGDYSDGLARMGMVKLYDMYESGIGDRVIESTLTGDSDRIDQSKAACRVTALVTAEGKHKLKVFLCNRSQDYDANIEFKSLNSYKLTAEKVLTAPNINSWVYSKASEDVFRVTEEEKNSDNFTSYHMPAKSAVMLTLETSQSLAGGEESNGDDEIVPNQNVETEFTDLDGVWARGEIAKMKELGFVSGVTNTEFAPFSDITRAEFAAIMARTLNLSLEYPIIFSDVDKGAWYAPFVNAMYYEGIMKGSGGEFRPDDSITLEEAAVSAVRVLKTRNIAPADSDKIKASFKNNGGVSDWAYDDVLYAAGAGLLNRLYENGNLNTAENANRAEAASILYRLYSLTK